jgi:hypothetical protein
MAERVPSPADAPSVSARSLLQKIMDDGGRIYRMRELLVFVLTDKPDLATWLLSLGAKSYVPRGSQQMLQVAPLGSFRMARGGKPTWDLYIHTIPVTGDESIWHAAAHLDDVGFYEPGDEEPV